MPQNTGFAFILSSTFSNFFHLSIDLMSHNTLRTAVSDTDRTDMKKIGNLIRAHRYAAELSQVEFAAKLGKTQATVSEYELGSIIPPLDILLQMAQIFSRALGRSVTVYDLTELDALKSPDALTGITETVLDLAKRIDSIPDSDPRKKIILEILKLQSDSHDIGGDDSPSDPATRK